jgi:predicted esterase
MKRLSWIITLVFWVGVLLACGDKATKEDLVQPGDMVGEYLITTGGYEGVSFTFDFFEGCAVSSNNYSCDIAEGTDINLTYPVYNSSIEELEKNWSHFRLQVYVEGQKVDMDAFGTIDFDQPDYGKMRAWDVVIKDVKLGDFSVRIEGSIEDESFDDTWNFTIKSAGDIEATGEYPLLSSNPNLGQHPYHSEKADMDYLLYLPDDYGVDPNQKWPLILYLHGGQNVKTMDFVTYEGLPKILEDKGDFPFVVLSPHGEGEYEYWPEEAMVEALFTLIDEIEDNISLDPKRIYLSGVSAGGNGTWEIGLRHPERFAALVPVMGYIGWPFEVPENICDLKEVPIWAFHGEKDEVIPFEAEAGLVEALETCGGDIQFTGYPQGDHDDVGDLAYETPGLFDWLLAQSLGNSK